MVSVLPDCGFSSQFLCSVRPVKEGTVKPLHQTTCWIERFVGDQNANTISQCVCLCVCVCVCVWWKSSKTVEKSTGFSIIAGLGPLLG